MDALLRQDSQSDFAIHAWKFRIGKERRKGERDEIPHSCPIRQFREAFAEDGIVLPDAGFQGPQGDAPEHGEGGPAARPVGQRRLRPVLLEGCALRNAEGVSFIFLDALQQGRAKDVIRAWGKVSGTCCRSRTHEDAAIRHAQRFRRVVNGPGGAPRLPCPQNMPPVLQPKNILAASKCTLEGH